MSSYWSFPKLPKGPYSNGALLVPVWFIGGYVLVAILYQLPAMVTVVTAIMLSAVFMIWLVRKLRRS
ncbi:MAG: hypothetical protein K8T25_20440 [Planctomycetia bacterium]|nr:hypothetical protein [Planctomycetia bacterium]